MTQAIPENVITEYRALIDSLDENDDGMVSVKYLGSVLQIGDKELLQLVGSLDKDITKDEFFSYMVLPSEELEALLAKRTSRLTDRDTGRSFDDMSTERKAGRPEMVSGSVMDSILEADYNVASVSKLCLSSQYQTIRSPVSRNNRKHSEKVEEIR